MNKIKTILILLCTMTSCVSIIQNTIGNQLIDSKYEPNEQKNAFYTEVPYTIINGFIVIKAKINKSEKEYNFIFDTGACTLFSEDLINDFGLKNGITIVNRDANGSDVVGKSFISTLTIGSLNINNLRINTTSTDFFETKGCGEKIDGIIGFNILKQGYYYFNAPNRKLIVTNQIEKLPKENLANPQRIKRKMAKIYIPVVGYKKEWLLIDSGYADGDILINKSSKLINPKRKPIKEFEYPLGSIVSEKLTTFSYYEDIITICNFKLLTSIQKINTEKFSNRIGSKFISNNNVILDVKNKRIFTTILKKKSTVDTIRNIRFIYKKGILRVAGVVFGSKISAQLIKTNDTIIKINDTEMSIFKNECDFLKWFCYRIM